MGREGEKERRLKGGREEKGKGKIRKWGLLEEVGEEEDGQEGGER